MISQKMSKDDFLDALANANRIMTWIIRLAGLIAAWIAVYCCFSPIAAAADIIGDGLNYLPCGGYIEDLLEGVVDAVLCCMSCAVGCSCGLFVIAVTWLYMRPLYGALMLAGSVTLCVCAVLVRSQHTSRRKPKGYHASRDHESSDQE